MLNLNVGCDLFCFLNHSYSLIELLTETDYAGIFVTLIFTILSFKVNRGTTSNTHNFPHCVPYIIKHLASYSSSFQKCKLIAGDYIFKTICGERLLCALTKFLWIVSVLVWSRVHQACCQIYSLVRLLALHTPRAWTAVMSLDDKGVLLLQLAVHQAACPQLTLARRYVQHHCLKRSLQPMDVECTDLP